MDEREEEEKDDPLVRPTASVSRSRMRRGGVVESSIIKQGPVIARNDPEGDEGLPLGDDGR
jgi:hypothetical protein